MHIKVKSSRRKFSRITLNLASMIDVIFLLLTYFMVTMVIITPEDRLSSTLQTKQDSSTGNNSDLQPQIVEVLSINGRETYRLGVRLFFDKESLTQALSLLDKKIALHVVAGGDPGYGFTVAAMQAGIDAGFPSNKISYVASE